MATYTIDKRPKRLREGDRVIFSVPGEPDLEYEVNGTFLSTLGGDPNRAIFVTLGLNRVGFASLAYGYDPRLGDWPQSKDRDFAALCRLVNALYDEIEKGHGKKTETSGGESPSLVSLGWVWSQNKPGEANPLEDCEAPSKSREMALEEAKESQLSPVYVFELFAGPVKKYTNQLVEETL